MRVFCTLPNMSAQVSGVRFTPAPDGSGWVSEDLTPALAAAFAAVPGYFTLPEEPELAPEPEPASEPEPAPEPRRPASRKAS